ncbi:MAG: ABC transporter substrate-binding protein [Oscillospiraceae bacterium]
MRRSPIYRILSVLTALLCAGSAGCASHPQDTSAPPEGTVSLVYYTIGEPDEDLALVNRELNRILLERYGFTVEYHKIGWNDYTAQLNSLVNTNQEYDIAFTWTDSYVTNAVAGAWLNLTPYLDNLGAEMYDAIDPQLWKGVTIDGSVWGVPTNKELATPMHFLFSQELVDKYHIDISQYRSFASLEPLLAQIAQEEPGCIPCFLTPAG